MLSERNYGGMTEVDDYQLPAGILGRHPEEFFAALGRIVCVCAVLEDKVTTLRHTLAGAEQGQFTHEPVGQQIKAARARVRALREPAALRVEEFLDAATSAFDRRNALVHSSFPAQADGRIWGHRPTRDRRVSDGRADTVETNLDDLRELIGVLAAPITSFNGVHALATVAKPG